MRMTVRVEVPRPAFLRPKSERCDDVGWNSNRKVLLYFSAARKIEFISVCESRTLKAEHTGRDNSAIHRVARRNETTASVGKGDGVPT
jgi:hypothetical protein